MTTAAPGPVPEPAVDDFVARYFAGADPDDLADLAPDEAQAAARAHYHLARVRRPGEIVVRAVNPTREDDGWVGPHTSIMTVTDDTPFIVDSVTAALTRHGSDIVSVLHPVAMARRDAEGRLAGFDDLAVAGRDGAVAESYLHVEVGREPAGALGTLETVVATTLASVRAVVDDWIPMRDRAIQLARRLERTPPQAFPTGDVHEVASFLDWLADDHFTFVAARRDEIGAAPGAEARRDPTADLGLARGARSDFGVEAHGPDAGRGRAARELLVITKSPTRSPVHRAVPLDSIAVVECDEQGVVVAEHHFLGLFTSSAYTDRPERIPVLRQKLAEIVARTDFDPRSHDGRALVAILETLPRDDLFRMGTDELGTLAVGVLQMGDRRRVRLFVNRDRSRAFASCLVFIPRDRYTTPVRVRVLDRIRAAFASDDVEYHVLVTDALMARLHLLVHTPDPDIEVDVAALEAALALACRSWTDDLRDALLAAHGEEDGAARFVRRAGAFPAAYQADVPAVAALADLEVLEALDPGGDLAVRLERSEGSAEGRAKLFRAGAPLVLSDVVPVLEHLGVQVVDERPYEITLDGATVWVYSFGLRGPAVASLADADAQARVAELFLGVWSGAIENDGLNRLVLLAGLTARDVVVVRAYCRYLRQAGLSYGDALYADALAAHAGTVTALVALFHERFDPARHPEAPPAVTPRAEALRSEIVDAIDAVASLDEDRILRGILAAVLATVRTNVYQADPAGTPKPYVALKLDPRELGFLPAPRPRHEVWVYAPATEGVHLRGGFIAGGIRWSDRKDDFRTEILGLMRTQTLKNVVIVPEGAKGGFVVKRGVAADAVECYRTLIRGMLDVTDNLVDGRPVVPRDVVVYDSETDAYLVVAADKGTGSFSDVANALAAEYGFWLGDAFASGGSAGYDHKAMGITARGAWESARSHFRSLGVDTDTDVISVAGIGDMSGDVFGNGMLRGNLRVVAAFDHRHVFLDPDPDLTPALGERRRLFETPRSSWGDYDPAVISTGGGVYPRTAKSVPLSFEARRVLGVEAEVMTPDELVRCVLRAPVDLLWNGGIGTFVKAAAEAHAEVADKTNDGVRVDAGALRARVVVEGGNLGVTPAGRVEYALAGGRIYADAIDNSAGVDTSDHEVNIKILLGAAVRNGRIGPAERDAVLAAMTDDVAAAVLADNRDQATLLELALVESADLADVHGRQLAAYEDAGELDRALEGLPTSKAFDERRARGLGLTAPELASLLGHAKRELERSLLVAGLPDDAFLAERVVGYFPPLVRERFADLVPAHPLRHELLVTSVANVVVNRAGISARFRLGEETGAPVDQLVCAHLAAAAIFEIDELWPAVDAVPGGARLTMLLTIRQLLERASRWLVQHHDCRALTSTVDALAPGVREVTSGLAGLLRGEAASHLSESVAALVAEGVPAELVARVASLDHGLGALDATTLAGRTGAPVGVAAATYYALADALHLEWLRSLVGALGRQDRWQTEARAALRDNLFDHWQALATVVMASGSGSAAADAMVDGWLSTHATQVARYREVLAEIERSGTFDLATLAVALRELRSLT